MKYDLSTLHEAVIDSKKRYNIAMSNSSNTMKNDFLQQRQQRLQAQNMKARVAPQDKAAQSQIQAKVAHVGQKAPVSTTLAQKAGAFKSWTAKKFGN